MIVQKPTLLLVCDTQESEDLFCRVLREYCRIVTVNSAERAKQELSCLPNVALTLIHMKDYVDLLTDIKHSYSKDFPTVVCVNGNSEEDANRAIACGAFDIIRTPFQEEVIKNRILNIMWRTSGYVSYQDGAYSNKTLLFGTTDKLTQLHNRIYGEQAINGRLSAPDFSHGLFVLMNIDRFTAFNEHFGCQRGDQLLVSMAQALKECFGEDTVICRLRGDEFAVFMEEHTESSEVAAKIKVFLEKVCNDVGKDGSGFDLSISVGTVRAPKHGKSFHELCEKADKALYRSKSMGRNIVTDYSENMVFATRQNDHYNITALDYQNILDSFNLSAVYAITAEGHRILYYNKKAKEVAPKMTVGSVCTEVWEHDCSKCPIIGIGDAEFSRAVRYDPQFGEEVDVRTVKIMWHDRIPAYLICISPRIVIDPIKSKITDGMSEDSAEPMMNPFRPKGKSIVADDGTEACRYSETIYCLEGYRQVTEKEQSIIDTLFFINHGAGIITGYFDDRLSISMISDLAVKVLGYGDYNDFRAGTGACLYGMMSTEGEREFFRKKLLTCDDDVWSYPLTGKGGEVISLRIGSMVTMSGDGRKMWYLSLRRYSEHHHDSITGGYNYEGFVHYVERLRTRNADLRQYAILYIDLKGFKALNELCGSEGGDNLLVALYKQLSTGRLEPVVCARKGSDHFLLLVKKTMLDLDVLSSLLNVTWQYGTRKLFLHCTCGIYNIDDNDQPVNSMISRANFAMEHIEDEYVTPYAFFDQTMRANSLSRIEVLSGFTEGVEKKEFQVYFQPIVDVKTEKAVSAEALVRWISEEKGVIPPSMFIPTLEQSGYVVKLDKYVVKAVWWYLHKRTKNRLPLLPISVNLSRMDFFDGDEIDHLLSSLERDPEIRKYLHFEITETSYASLKEKQMEFIETVRKLNSEVYLDDYGSGSASLEMVCDYNFNALKIDMLYITKMTQNAKVYTLVETIIRMAHRLGLKVIAEGVETREQLELLRSADCDYAQGYLFSKPMPEKEFDAYLDRQAKAFPN